jgi:hypothetical protein
VTWVKPNLVSIRLEIMLVSEQDRSTVLVRLETVLVWEQDRSRFASNVPQDPKSFWAHLMEQLHDVGHVQSRFGLFGDIVCASVR